MSDNGKPKVLVSVTLQDGKMAITYGNFNHALLSHAMRMASLQLDNMIIQSQTENQSPIAIPENIIKKLRS